MKIKQGTVLPTTGIGVGYLFLLIYVIYAWNLGLIYMLKIPKAYILLLIFALMQFSYKDFIISESHPSCFIIKYRLLFFIPISSIIPFDNYSHFVYKKIRKSYNVSQAGAAGMTINTGKHKEEYYAIVGRNIKSKETEEICKGSKIELSLIICSFILPLNIPVYVGAPKKGYEFKD